MPRSLGERSCSHLDATTRVAPRSAGCDRCIEMGDTWVHLRACLVCGRVGCCDQSKNKHATKHFHEAGHPVIQSVEPGESWIYCYVDERVVGDDG